MVKFKNKIDLEKRLNENKKRSRIKLINLEKNVYTKISLYNIYII